MALEEYYEPFFMQNWTGTPDGFGGGAWEWEDGETFMGLFIQESSNEIRLARAHSIAAGGVLVTDSGVGLKEGDIIRRASDNLYLRVTGKPVKAPGPAASKLQKMNVEKTEQPEGPPQSRRLCGEEEQRNERAFAASGETGDMKLATTS